MLSLSEMGEVDENLTKEVNLLESNREVHQIDLEKLREETNRLKLKQEKAMEDRNKSITKIKEKLDGLRSSKDRITSE